ncbi:MAG TPA: GNAT family N-acetyltransferase [Nitrososphaera sp.]|nr:GNAT family N-acetyltransferase [Nitrososphaera sp.]
MRDKKEILSFCTNTFSWGDYIDQVWDYWFEDKSGRLLVAESSGGKVAVAHVTLCPGKSRIWLEGIRVHPAHRRSRIATSLIEAMIGYGRKMGATRALAVVAKENRGSQQMMEKNGFNAISSWAYYGTSGDLKGQKSKASIATSYDAASIWRYLLASKIYSLSARTYVKSWHWYPFDRKALRDLIKEKRVLVTGAPVDGVAVINQSGYWQRKNILQIVYIDSESTGSLRDLLSFVINIYTVGKYKRLQVLCQENNKVMSAIDKIGMEESEQFLLYDKVFTSSARH